MFVATILDIRLFTFQVLFRYSYVKQQQQLLLLLLLHFQMHFQKKQNIFLKIKV